MDSTLQDMSLKRKNKRLKVLWRVYRNDTVFGYLVDLSYGGAKIRILEKHKEMKEDIFDIKIYPAETLRIDYISLEVHKVWLHTSEFIKSHEIGIQFKNLSTAQLANIERFMSFFEKFPIDD